MAFDKTIRINIIADSKGVTTGVAQANAQLSSLGKTVDRIGRSFSSFLAIWAGRAIISGAADMVRQFADFDHQLRLVQRTAGLTSDEMAKLGDALRGVAVDLGVDISQLEALAIGAGRAGIKSTAAMVDIATVSTKMQAIAGGSTEQISTALIKLQNIFGGTFSGIASGLAYAGKEVIASEGEITQAVLRMVGSGKTLGFEFPTLVALAATSLDMAGQRASRVGNEWDAAIRKMAENASKLATLLGLTKDEFVNLLNTAPAEALFAVAEALSRMKDKTAAVNMEIALFGATGGKVMPYLREQLQKTKDIMAQVGIETQRGTYLTGAYAGIADDLQKKIDKLAASFKELKLSLADAFDIPISNIISSWSRAIREFSDNINKLGVGLTTVMTIMGQTPIGKVMEMLGGLSVPKAQDIMAPGVRDKYKNYMDLGKIDVNGKAVSEPATGQAAIGVTTYDPTAQAQIEIQAEQKKLDELASMWQAYQDKKLASDLATIQTQTEYYNFAIENQKIANASLWSVAGSLRDTFASGISTMFIDWMKGTLDIKKAFIDLGFSMIKIIVDFIAQKLVAMAIGFAMMSTELGALVAFGTAAASALAAAATFMATITFGGAVAAGTSALAAGVLSAKGIAMLNEGGWVGGMGKKDSVPALLTPGEYVLNRSDAAAMAGGSMTSNVTVNINGGIITSDPIQIQRLYREHLRDAIRNDIRSGKDRFYG